MMKALRSSTGQAAYFNGGQAEKIFQNQLDELMIERLSEVSGGIFSDVMFEEHNPKPEESDDSAVSTSGANSAAHNASSPSGNSHEFDASV